MANSLESRGFFWWWNEAEGGTNSQSNSVPGLLKIGDDGEIDLELDGSLWFAQPVKAGTFGEWPLLDPEQRITGRLDSGPDGVSSYALLLNLQKTSFELRSPDVPDRQTYKASHCIVKSGLFTSDFTLDLYRELNIDANPLEEWLELKSIITGEDSGTSQERKVLVEYKNHEFNYDHPRFNLKIRTFTTGASLGFFPSFPSLEAVFKQYAYIEYAASQQTSLDELLYIFQSIEELIALLIGFYKTLPFPQVQTADTANFGDTSKIYYYRGTPTSRDVTRWLKWVEFREIEKLFGELFAGWLMRKAEYGPACTLYLASLRKPLPYSEHQFINLLWSLETCHRRKQLQPEKDAKRVTHRDSVLNTVKLVLEKSDFVWLKGKLKYAHEPTLEQRLFDCLDSLPVNFMTGQLRSFCKRCADLRNRISHEGGPTFNETTEEFHDGLRVVLAALSHLCHAFWLIEIGVPVELVKSGMISSPLGTLIVLPTLSSAGLLIHETAE